jgi:hypothetical protein
MESLCQRVTPRSDSSATNVGEPPTVPLNPGTDVGLLKLLLLVPTAPPTLVPAKPATDDGLLRLELVPSAPPVAVPVKPDTLEGLLRFAFTMGAPTEPAFVLGPTPVEVVVETPPLTPGIGAVVPATPAVALVGTCIAPATRGAAAAAPIGAPPGIAVDAAVVAIVVDALVVVIVVEAFVRVMVVAGLLLAPLREAGAVLVTGATFDGIPAPPGPSTAVEMSESAAVPAAVPTDPAAGATWASA